MTPPANTTLSSPARVTPPANHTSSQPKLIDQNFKTKVKQQLQQALNVNTRDNAVKLGKRKARFSGRQRKKPRRLVQEKQISPGKCFACDIAFAKGEEDGCVGCDDCIRWFHAECVTSPVLDQHWNCGYCMELNLLQQCCCVYHNFHWIVVFIITYQTKFN